MVLSDVLEDMEGTGSGKALKVASQSKKLALMFVGTFFIPNLIPVDRSRSKMCKMVSEGRKKEACFAWVEDRESSLVCQPEIQSKAWAERSYRRTVTHPPQLNSPGPPHRALVQWKAPIEGSADGRIADIMLHEHNA
jgi:hypothetical protein